MSKYEKIQVAIPVDNTWNLKDLEAKAEAIGINKNDLIFNAVDLMMNFDNDFLKYIKDYSEGLKIPEYLVIQNLVIGRMADEEAELEVFKEKTRILEEFMSVKDIKGSRVLTGKELKDVLKDSKLRGYKEKLAKLEEYNK